MKPQILRDLRFLFSLACGLWPRWCSGRRRARPLCVPVGGGPPARSPHASCARSGRSRGPARPRHRPPAPRPGLAPRSPARPRHRPWEPKPGPPLPVGVMGVSRVEFLGCSGACCDKRRQSEGFFAEMPLKGPCWAIFSRQSALRPGLVGDVAHEACCGGGFAALEAGWRRVAGVSYL